VHQLTQDSYFVPVSPYAAAAYHPTIPHEEEPHKPTATDNQEYYAIPHWEGDQHHFRPAYEE